MGVGSLYAIQIFGYSQRQNNNNNKTSSAARIDKWSMQTVEMYCIFPLLNFSCCLEGPDKVVCSELVYA